MQVPEWDAACAADFLQGLSSFSTLQGASLSSLSVQVFVFYPHKFCRGNRSNRGEVVRRGWPQWHWGRVRR